MRLHIGYLLSLENSERSRMACVTYLQNWLHSFYPSRPDLVQQAEALARELGGHLSPPVMSWKWDWLRRLFGWDTAKRVQETLVGAKWSALRWWDGVMARFEQPA
jgi:hypothetical protein